MENHEKEVMKQRKKSTISKATDLSSKMKIRK